MYAVRAIGFGKFCGLSSFFRAQSRRRRIRFNYEAEENVPNEVVHGSGVAALLLLDEGGRYY